MDAHDALRPLPAGHGDAAHRLLAALVADPRVECVLLTGSLATGQGDAHSDLDLGVVVADADTVEDLAAHVPALLDDVVHHQQLTRGPVRIVNLVTGSWARVDVLVEPRRVAQHRGQPPHLVLFDRAGVAGRLRTAEPAPDPTALAGLVGEFLRVLGLLAVSVGRDEPFLGTQGVMLLRGHLLDLFRLGAPPTRPTGHKRHPWLTSEHRAVLENQPPLTATTAAVVDGHRAAAEAFLPLARRLMHEQHQPWPEAFERATLAHLRATCGLDLTPTTPPDDHPTAPPPSPIEPPSEPTRAQTRVTAPRSIRDST